MIKETNPGQATVNPVAGQDPHLPRTKLSEIGVGDHITVTTSDGASRDYRVTGRKVVDPHLADQSGPAGCGCDAGRLPAARPGAGKLA